MITASSSIDIITYTISSSTGDLVYTYYIPFLDYFFVFTALLLTLATIATVYFLYKE